MSLMHPVGPEPPGVYWRRRLFAVGAVVLVLIAFWFLFLRGRGTPSAQPTPSPSPSGTKTASSPSASPSKTSDATPACADSDIAVSITLDGTNFTAGTPIKMTEGIKNVGSQPCQRDIGAKANTIIVTSGGYDVWSSDDCSPGGEANVVTMKPGDEYQVTVTWKGTLTQGNCPSNPPKAQPGSYEAQGKNGKVVSKKKTFILKPATG